MIRRLNYTGRRKIPRSRVTIRLLPAASGAQTFAAELDLAELDLPPASRVFVEAYNATSYMRFDFGTVRAPVAPADTRLRDITPSPLPKFRVKVVDRSRRHGLLLAVADKVLPLRPDEELAARQSLLPVEFVDLGDRVWRLDVSDWPVLELNRRIADIGAVARSADSFMALVYPEVVRQILHEAVIVQDQTDPDLDDSEWTCLWLRYVCDLAGVGPPPEGTGEQARGRQLDWIDAAVQAFCRSRDARLRFERMLAGASP